MSEVDSLDELWSAHEHQVRSRPVCLQCGTSGESALKLPPSTPAELTFWVTGVCLLLLGSPTTLGLALVFSVWRRTAKTAHCRSCGSSGHLVPGSSPAGEARLRSVGLLK